MVNPVNVVKGVLMFVLGIFFTIISYYIIPALIEEMSAFGDATTTTLLNTVFWSGYILVIILAVFVAPAMMIFRETTPEQ